MSNVCVSKPVGVYFSDSIYTRVGKEILWIFEEIVFSYKDTKHVWSGRVIQLLRLSESTYPFIQIIQKVDHKNKFTIIEPSE